MERLKQKQAEYAEDEDALAQFERAGVLQGCGPEMALLGMVSKHIVALYDLARVEELTGWRRSGKRWEEYTGDIVVYMLILGAMVSDRVLKEKQEPTVQATQGKGKKGKR